MPAHASSDSEGSQGAPDDGQQRYKRRRRLHGACDACKRKKTKCDSAIMPNNICTNCISINALCEHTVPRQKKRDRQAEQIVQLEEKIRQLEAQLAAGSSDTHSGISGSRHTSPGSSATDSSLPIPQTLPSSSASSPRETRDDPEDYSQLTDIFHRMSFDCVQDRFFGKASLLSFASEAVITREGASKPPSPEDFARRAVVWNPRSWEEEYMATPHPNYVYPEPDLLEKLLDAYERWIHAMLPIVHWPTFMRDIRQDRHLSDPSFGRVLLAMCAVASRFVDDDRILTIDPEHPETSGPSAGWKYLTQTPLIRPNIIDRAELGDLQFYVLVVFYFLGSSSPHTGWSILGMAIRLAIDRGMHTQRGVSKDAKTTREHELEKRVFWALISLEWLTSTALGRPSCLHDEDIEVDYPIECDDEYWDCEVDDPTQAWKQPPGKPSKVEFLTAHLKLCEIAAFMIRTLYSSKKSKSLTGSIGEQWCMRIVSELDSSMNRWKDTLPQHLRWDPTTPNQEHFTQQLLLHSAFYYLQIQIHRPFLRVKSLMSMPALAICTNAARACSHLAEASMKRSKFTSISVISSCFAATTVLAINFWSRDKTVAYSPQKEVDDIQKLFLLIKSGETRWTLACRFADMLIQLFSLGDTLKPVRIPEPSRKRARENMGPAGGPPDANLAPSNQFDASNQAGFTPSPATFAPNTGHQNNSQPDLQTLPDIAQPNWDWELSSLLLTQFGYTNTPSGNPSGMGAGVGAGGFTGNSHHGHGMNQREGGPPSGTFSLGQTTQYPEPNAPNPNSISIWTNAPTAFSIEAWDNYLGSFSSETTPF